jgi:hypothetical protein
MKFIIKSDAVFEAEDIDDAFMRLSNYYADVSNQNILIESGYIEIFPLDSDHKSVSSNVKIKVNNKNET